MRISETTLCWNPGTSHVAVLRHPIGPRACDQFECTFGAGETAFEAMTSSDQAAAMLATAIDAIALDGVDAQAMRTTLMQVDDLRGSFDQGSTT